MGHKRLNLKCRKNVACVEEVKLLNIYFFASSSMIHIMDEIPNLRVIRQSLEIQSCMVACTVHPVWFSFKQIICASVHMFLFFSPIIFDARFKHNFYNN